MKVERSCRVQPSSRPLQMVPHERRSPIPTGIIPSADWRPAIEILGAFNQGGASVGQGFDTQNSYEFQDYVTIAHQAHLWEFGARLRGQTDNNISPQNFNGTFVFAGGLAPALDANNLAIPGQFQNITSIERYRRTLLQLPGGAPTQFSISTGQPELLVAQFDAGIFAADDWRVRPNLTLSLGLRYEMQTNIHDWRDFRLASRSLGRRVAATSRRPW